MIIDENQKNRKTDLFLIYKYFKRLEYNIILNIILLQPKTLLI